ncbi:MAG: DUF3421 domain-containing protein [Pseudobdellovibrionaceae bacterium]|nr:DUF3421 domain-containing protein [Pseudobdellovibrionaceae bacterium]
MLQRILFCIAFISTGISCSSATLKKAPLLCNQVFDRDADATANTPETPAPASPEAAEPVPMPKEEKAVDEKVSPPGNISGSYLICIESKAPTAAVPESTVTCALRDQKTNNKIDLKSQYPNAQWAYDLADSSSLTITRTELNANPDWHLSIILKSPSMEQTQFMRNAIKFMVTVQDSAGVKRQEVAPVSFAFLRWQSLDGGRVPTTAAVGGTEHDGLDNLFLCRMYLGSEIIPGKMIIHYNDASKSICYATMNGTEYASHTDDARTMIFRSDVLVIAQGTFDDYFEWLPATAGLKPAQAIVSGLDTLGNPLYACRGLQAADGMVEQTPGVLRPGAPGCSHEYYGAVTTTSYQVLAWKETGTRKIMDGRSILPP